MKGITFLPHSWTAPCQLWQKRVLQTFPLSSETTTLPLVPMAEVTVLDYYFLFLCMLLNPLSRRLVLLASQRHIQCLVLYVFLNKNCIIHAEQVMDISKLKPGSDKWTCLASVPTGRLWEAPLQASEACWEELFVWTGAAFSGSWLLDDRHSSLASHTVLILCSSHLSFPPSPPTNVYGGFGGTVEQKLDYRLKVQLSYSSSTHPWQFREGFSEGGSRSWTGDSLHLFTHSSISCSDKSKVIMVLLTVSKIITQQHSVAPPKPFTAFVLNPAAVQTSQSRRSSGSHIKEEI